MMLRKTALNGGLGLPREDEAGAALLAERRCPLPGPVKLADG